MKSKLIIFCLIGLGILSSCQKKDTDLFIPNNASGPDTVWVSNLSDASPVNILRRSLNKEIALDSLDITIGGTVQTRDGLTIMLLPQSLQLPAGVIANGKIHIESFLIKQKGDMIRMDKPTTSFGRVLISGGEIFVRFRKENVELHLAPGKNIYFKYADAFPSSFMKLFFGDFNNPERFNWLPTDSSNGGGGINVTAQPVAGYELFANRLHWINCDYFADTIGSRINVTASLPAVYTNANTAVYLVFKDQRSVMGMYGDAATRKFSSTKAPAGKQVIIVSITRKGENSFYLAHETITTGASGTISGVQTVPLSPQPTSLPDIKAYLATL